MWYGLTANEDLLIRERTVELTTSIKREIETHFAEQLAALGRMAKRWEIRGGTPHGEWENDANSYIADHSGYRTIAIIGPDTKMRWRVPNKPSDLKSTPEFPVNNETKKHYARAKNNPQVTVFPALDRSESNHFLVALFPLKKSGKPDGCIAAKISIAALLTDAMRDVIADEYAVEARYQNQLVFQLNTHLVQSSNALREQIYIDLPDVSLLLNITPTISASEKIRSALPEIGLLAGIIFSGLLGYTIHLYQHAGLRRRRQVAAQHELNVALELLQNANKAKSNFLARMSHELRTPLNAIIGFSQIIKDQRFGDVANERYLEYSTYIFDSGNHLLNLIGDVLDLSKIEAGELEIHREAIDLADLIDAEIQLFSHAASQKGVTLTQEIHPGLPPLNADRRAVKQMLSNLVSNAIKFTPQGGTVAVYASTTYESVRIDVTDTGIGMTKQETQIALAPFQQVANPFTSDDLGTGLGLPIVKSLIELHNGRLSIISNPRSGTRVTLTFPH